MNNIMKKYMTRQGMWRMFCMVTAIFMMGFSLSFLILIDLGTDAFSCMNLGFSSALHMSFGTWQLILNLILFVITVIFRRDLIGPGTFVNMILIGYTADFFGGVWNKMPVFEKPMPITLRFFILIVALAVFVAVAAIYMTAEMGMAPFDAIPFMIAEKTEKISFRWIRMLWDTIAMLLGLILGAKVGVITILMILTLGPVVAWFGDHVAGKLFGKNLMSE